jgi:hypothetical protein
LPNIQQMLLMVELLQQSALQISICTLDAGI